MNKNVQSLYEINFNRVKKNDSVYINKFLNEVPESVAVSMLAALLWAS